MVMQKSLSTAMNGRLIGAGKETIILAHGYGGDQSIWEKVSSSLAIDYQVLLFDWVFSGAVEDKYGCYEGFADDLIGLMEEMRLMNNGCVFVGHSMSGIIGCIASLQKPHLFTKLILVGSSPRYLNSDDYEGGFDMPVIEQLFVNIKFNYDQWSTGFASAVVDGSDPLSVQKFADCLKRMGSKVALPLAKTVFLSDYRDILEKVIVPCTLIQTVNDVVVPHSVPNYMIKKIKGESTVEIIQTQGHFPQLTAPHQFLQVLYKVMNP